MRMQKVSKKASTRRLSEALTVVRGTGDAIRLHACVIRARNSQRCQIQKTLSL